MDYTVKYNFVLCGDAPSLSRVAEAIARRQTSGGVPNRYHPKTYEQKFEKICSRLMEDAHSGILRVCDQFGRHAPIADIVNSDPLAILNPNYPELSTLHVKEKHLAAWGAIDGDTFSFQDTGYEDTFSNGSRSILEPPEPEFFTDKTEAVEPVSGGPVPLSTGDIAFCFAGLRWSESEWKKPLGDKPKWLCNCVVIPGQQGVSQTRWNPVYIGAALVRQGHVTMRNVRAKFQAVHLLLPWLDTWKTYEADCDESK